LLEDHAVYVGVVAPAGVDLDRDGPIIVAAVVVAQDDLFDDALAAFLGARGG